MIKSTRILLLIPIATLLVFTGCLQFKNLPDKECIVASKDVMLGTYHLASTDGAKGSLIIGKSNNPALPYKVTGGTLAEGKSNFSFQVYQIADSEFLFGKLPRDPFYYCFRIDRSATQTTLRLVEQDYFVKHPKAMPGIVISGEGLGRKVLTQASPEQIKDFLARHANNKGLYSKSTTGVFDNPAD